MELIPDPPYIRYGEVNTKQPRCPICGNICEIIYKDVSRDIVGCDECLTGYDAVDEEECFPEWGDE